MYIKLICNVFIGGTKTELKEMFKFDVQFSLRQSLNVYEH